MFFKNVINNWKTSGLGAIAGVLALLQLFGVTKLTPEQMTAAATSIVAIIGLVAKDQDKTGVAQ